MYGAYLTILAWTFCILCLPTHKGALIFDTPTRFFRQPLAKYAPLMIWCIAVLINVVTIKLTPSLYYCTSITHLLLLMLTTPQPYYRLIIINTMLMFYDVWWLRNPGHLPSALTRFTDALLHVGVIAYMLIAIYPQIILMINTHGIP